MKNFMSNDPIFVKSKYGQVYDPVAERLLGKIVAFAWEDEPVRYGVVEKIIRDGIDNNFTPPNISADVWVVVAYPVVEKGRSIFKHEGIPVRRVWLCDTGKIDEKLLQLLVKFLKGKKINENAPQLIDKDLSYSDINLDKNE